jgi:hypothetical protein
MRDLKDQFGREVQKGDTIVYAGRSGSSQWLTRAVIEEIVDKAGRDTYMRYNLKVKVTNDKWGREDERRATLTNPTFVVID